MAALEIRAVYFEMSQRPSQSVCLIPQTNCRRSLHLLDGLLDPNALALCYAREVEKNAARHEFVWIAESISTERPEFPWLRNSTCRVSFGWALEPDLEEGIHCFQIHNQNLPCL